jgi:hypothetical protein
LTCPGRHTIVLSGMRWCVMVPLKDDYQLSGSQAKELTEGGTAKYPDIQNSCCITLADVIDLRSNSRDKGAYEAYKAVIEIIAVCKSPSQTT